MSLKRWHWIIAGIVAGLIHVALFTNLRPPTSGERAGATSPKVQVAGSAAQVFGTDERPPDSAAAARAAETPEKAIAEPGAPAEREGPVREAEPTEPVTAPEEEARQTEDESRDGTAEAADAKEVRPGQARELTAEPAQNAVAAEHEPIEAEAEKIAVTAEREPIEGESESVAVPVQRPEPTAAERKPVSRPQRTTRKRAEKRGSQQRRSAGAGQGRSNSGSRTASPGTGSGPQRATASPGDVRRYAGLVRARIARNRPSSRGRRGTAVVQFAISRGGGLQYVRLIRSSGDSSLDRDAVGSVRRAAPFPRPPRGMRAGQLRFSIPFRFR